MFILDYIEKKLDFPFVWINLIDFIFIRDEIDADKIKIRFINKEVSNNDSKFLFWKIINYFLTKILYVFTFFKLKKNPSMLKVYPNQWFII